MKTTEETLQEICDILHIGKAARTHSTIIANVQNAFRRSECLSRIENHHTQVEKDEDEEETEVCPLRWGDDPDDYLARYKELHCQNDKDEGRRTLSLDSTKD